ncbi:MAG: cell division protein ZapA [Deltaproteobacteria bacterium]|nr:cell division protein ZapA [Deltaproteobacteria bacterium]
MKRAVEVEILGQKLKISSDAEESHVHRVAGYVDAKMQEVSSMSSPIGKSNIATLAALNIADDYHRLKDNYDKLLQRLNHLTNRIATTLSEEG